MNKTSRYQFTILVPIYNEEGNIPAIEKAFEEYLPACPLKGCVLMVDDCSSDQSLAKIREVCSRHDDFFYLAHKSNCGLSAVMRTAQEYIESEWMGYIDADLQTDPADFSLLLEHIGEYPMVTGIRRTREDGFRKKFQSKVGNGFRRIMTGDGATDTGCPLKVIRSDVFRRMPLFEGMHRFLPALALLQEGVTYKEIQVTHRPRTAGVSKFNMWNRLRGFRDCFFYRRIRRNYLDPRILE